MLHDIIVMLTFFIALFSSIGGITCTGIFLCNSGKEAQVLAKPGIILLITSTYLWFVFYCLLTSGGNLAIL